MICKNIHETRTTSASDVAEINRQDQQPSPAKRQKTGNFRLVYMDDQDECSQDASFKDVEREIIDEINTYYSSVYTVEEDTDPLMFYKTNQKNYPHLSRLAKCLFSIPASSVPSESLFSKAKEITTDSRNRLKPHLIESLLFIKENSKFNDVCK